MNTRDQTTVDLSQDVLLLPWRTSSTRSNPSLICTSPPVTAVANAEPPASVVAEVALVAASVAVVAEDGWRARESGCCEEVGLGCGTVGFMGDEKADSIVGPDGVVPPVQPR